MFLMQRKLTSLVAFTPPQMVVDLMMMAMMMKGFFQKLMVALHPEIVELLEKARHSIITSSDNVKAILDLGI